MDQVKKESSKGKPVLGICNGAQILVESGLVPGCKDNIPYLALTDNKRITNNRVVGVGYYNTWTNLKMSTSPNRCAFTRHLKTNDSIQAPLAHGEGRFMIPKQLLNEIIKNKQSVFRYCDKDKNVLDEFPTNPNGSVYNIAAICNHAGNVMAIMPHPERTENGDPIFSSMKEYIESGNPVTNHTLNLKQSFDKYPDYVFKKNITTWKISTIITDNIASTVEQKLQKFGYDVTINRQVCWEIETNNKKKNILEKILNDHNKSLCSYRSLRDALE